MTVIPSTFDGNRSDHITEPLNPMTTRVPLPGQLQHNQLVSVRDDLHTGASSRGPDVRLGGPAVATQPFAIKRDLKGKNFEGGGSFMMTHPYYAVCRPCRHRRMRFRTAWPSQVWDAPRDPLGNGNGPPLGISAVSSVF